MAKRLNTFVATLAAIKTRTYAYLTEQHKILQKDALFQGLSKTYRPKFEGGDTFPPENHRVAHRAADMLKEVRTKWIEYMDAALTVDKGNQIAVADVEVDGVVLLKAVPVSTLLYLEKQLKDAATFLAKLPTLSPDETWEFSQNQGLYATPVSSQHRTKKTTKFITVAVATEHHPAQVKEVSEDEVVGFWDVVKYSAALPATQVATWVERVQKLQRAVKTAREDANTVEVSSASMGDVIFSYIFKD